MVRLVVAHEDHRRLRSHLRGPVEQTAFLLAAHDRSRQALKVFDAWHVPEEQLRYDDYGRVTLADQAAAHAISWAWNQDGSLIEAHHHDTNDPAAFSAFDLAGLHQWVPHVRWRLPGRAYTALVFARGSFDALIWTDGHTPHRLDGMEVAGEGVTTPTGISRQRWINSGDLDGD